MSKMSTTIRRRGLSVLFFSALVAAVLLGSAKSVQADPGERSLPAEVRYALADVRQGDYTAVEAIKAKRGDAALPDFAAARFDPDLGVRQAARIVAGDSYESLLFLLPMLEDDSSDFASAVASDVMSGSHGAGDFDRLKATDVVPLLATALKKHPEITIQHSGVLLLLARFPNNTTARNALSQAVREHNWDLSPLRTKPDAWEQDAFIVLLARCEAGMVPKRQVLEILKTNVRARQWMLGWVHLLSDKSLRQYAISLLYDTEAPYVERAADYGPQSRTCDLAWNGLSHTLKLESTPKYMNGVPQYDPKDLQRIYEYLGVRP